MMNPAQQTTCNERTAREPCTVIVSLLRPDEASLLTLNFSISCKEITIILYGTVHFFLKEKLSTQKGN